MLAFIAANGMAIAGAVLIILSGLSVILHLAHKDAIASVLDKVVDLEKKVGVQPPQV